MSDVQVDVGSGIWHCDKDAHSFDYPLAVELSKYFKERTVIGIADIGCGNGEYVEFFREVGLCAWGVDGNPRTKEFCSFCDTFDITKDEELDESDWVLCLEVAEHIPPQHEQKLLDLLARTARTGIVLSWFPIEGHGIGHFNPRDNLYVQNKLSELGFTFLPEATERLRKSASLWWFPLSLQVFQRA